LDVNPIYITKIKLTRKQQYQKYSYRSLTSPFFGFSTHDFDDVQEFAAQCNFAYYFDCSAKEDLNIDIIFYYAAKLLCDSRKNKNESS
jgi:hypothetical protein